MITIASKIKTNIALPQPLLLKITLIKSAIHKPKRIKDALSSLGLYKMHQSIIHKNILPIRGQINVELQPPNMHSGSLPNLADESISDSPTTTSMSDQDSFELLQGLPAIDSVYRCFSELEKKELEIKLLLEKHLSSVSGLPEKCQCMMDEIMSQVLEPLTNGSNDFEDFIQDMNDLVDTMKFKMGDLDRIRRHIFSTSKRAASYLRLKHALCGIDNAMVQNNHREAVYFMFIYLKYFDPSVIHLRLREKMLRIQNELVVEIESKLHEAIENNDSVTIARYTLLFLPLQKSERGMSNFCEYLAGQIKTDFNRIWTQIENARLLQVGDAGGKVSAQATFVEFFKRLHRHMMRSKKTLVQAFGPAGFAKALIRFQLIIAEYLNLFFNEFSKQWDIPSISAKINASLFGFNLSTRAPGGSATVAPNSQPLNLLDIAQLLEQQVIISNVIQTHLKFVHSSTIQAKARLQELLDNYSQTTKESTSTETQLLKLPTSELDQLFSTPPTEFPDYSISLDGDLIKLELDQINILSNQMDSDNVGNFSSFSSSLVHDYILLENYYIYDSIRFATNNAVAMRNNDLHSSTICDDVFFILRESINRSKATLDPAAIVQILNLTINKLNNALYNFIKEASTSEVHQLTRAITKRMKNSSYSSLLNSTSLQNSCTYLNSIEQCFDNVILLKNSTRESIKSLFNEHSYCLEHLNLYCKDMEKIEQLLRELEKNQVIQITLSLQPMIVAILDGFNYINLTISEQEYSENLINDPWVRNLIYSLDQLIVPIKSILSASGNEILFNTAAAMVADFFEKIIMTKRFNLLGSQQLDQDVCNIEEYFQSSLSIRSKFNRIKLITSLLTLEELEELETWRKCYSDVGTSSHAPMLNPSEIKRILALRIEFPQAKIDKLVLGE